MNKVSSVFKRNKRKLKLSLGAKLKGFLRTMLSRIETGPK